MKTAPFTEQSTEYFTITNGTEETIAFKVKTTAPKFYCVRPNAALVAPGETLQIQVIFLGLAEEPVPNFNCRDKFLVITLPSPNDLGEKSVADAWADLEAQFGSQAVSKKIKVKYLTGYKSKEDIGVVQNGTEPQVLQQQQIKDTGAGVDTTMVQEPPVLNSVNTPQRSMATADDIAPAIGNIPSEAAAVGLSSSIPAPGGATSAPVSAAGEVSTPIKQALDTHASEAGNTQAQTPVTAAAAANADTTIMGANTTGYETKADTSEATPRRESEEKEKKKDTRTAPVEEVEASSLEAPAKKEGSLNLAPLIIIAVLAFIIRWLYSRFSS